DQIERKNNSYQNTQQPLLRRQLQPRPEMSSHKPRNRPKKQRSQHKHERRTQHDRNQLSILQRADSMAHKERVRQDQLHGAILIRLEYQFVRSISLEERHRANALPALWLAIWSGQLRHF